ncbi:MAG: DUF4876 domain-containing protein [Ignavibacteriales bacterium]
MKKVISTIIIILLIMLQGCAEKPPVMPDGESQMTIKAVWNSSTDSIPHYLPMPNAKVILSSEYGFMVRYTNESGVLDLSGIPSAVYNVSVRMQHPSDPGIILVGTRLSIQTFSRKPAVDTVYAKPISSTGIAINEIYAAGPVSHLYWYDQYIELYNSSDSTKYLDGMLVMRFSSNNTNGAKGPGADEGNDGDIDGVTYIYKFPGKPGEKNYPFPPKKFLVIAQSAINHKSVYTSSVDLSKSDWEFYNQYSPSDIDNPKVPNLINMRSDQGASDFMIALTSDIVVIASGVDSNWQDGIDISTILDGVEYQQSSTTPKTLDQRVDRGYVISPPTYSGKSIQRREPGVDTNDGSLDFEILNHPTPGFQ